MSIVVIGAKITKEDLQKAREEFPEYIKITADIEKKIVAIGGEYHVDAEKLLLEKYDCRQKDIWGGGYNITTARFEANAIINLRSGKNDSTDILDPDIRNRFLKLVKIWFSGIKSLL